MRRGRYGEKEKAVYIRRWRGFAGHGRGRAGDRLATRGVSRRDTSGARMTQVARREGGGVWPSRSGSRRARARNANAVPSHRTHDLGSGDAHGPTGVDWRARNRESATRPPHAATADRHTGHATDRYNRTWYATSRTDAVRVRRRVRHPQAQRNQNWRRVIATFLVELELLEPRGCLHELSRQI